MVPVMRATSSTLSAAPPPNTMAASPAFTSGMSVTSTTIWSIHTRPNTRAGLPCSETVPRPDSARG